MFSKINKKKLKSIMSSFMLIGVFVLLFAVSRPAFAAGKGVDSTTKEQISDEPDVYLQMQAV